MCPALNEASFFPYAIFVSFPWHNSTNSDSTAVDSLTGLDLLTVSWLGGLGLVDLAWWTWLGGFGLVDLAWWTWLGGFGLVGF